MPLLKSLTLPMDFLVPDFDDCIDLINNTHFSTVVRVLAYHIIVISTPHSGMILHDIGFNDFPAGYSIT